MNVQQEIDNAIERLCKAVSRQDAEQAWADLKHFHALRNPETIRQMEVKMGLR